MKADRTELSRKQCLNLRGRGHNLQAFRPVTAGGMCQVASTALLFNSVPESFSWKVRDVGMSCQCWALKGAHFSIGDLQVDTEIGSGLWAQELSCEHLLEIARVHR